jgi:hypothetical protein
MTPAYKQAAAAKLFKPVERAVTPDGGREWKGKFRVVNRAGMNAIAPPSWLLDDCIPDGGYCLLAGDSETFKSFIALDMALTVATGARPSTQWPGLWTPKRSGSVLYAAGEGRPGITARVRAWERARWSGEEVPNFVLVDPVPHPSEAEWDLFISETTAAAPDGYALVVLDTVGRSLQGLNENAQEEVSKLTAMAQAFQEEWGCAVLALHHAGHDAKAKRARGSSVFRNDPDTVLFVERNGRELAVKIEMQKQKDATAWETPRHVAMTTVQLSPVATSLVAMPSTAPTPKGKNDPTRNKDGVVDAVIDDVLADILSGNPTASWSHKDLAVAISAHKKVDGVSFKTLQNTTLHRLIETAGTHARRCYDPTRSVSAGRWRWVEPSTRDEE